MRQAGMFAIQLEWKAMLDSNDLPVLAAVVAEVKKLLQDSKNHFFALAELVCRHSAPSDMIRQLWLELDSSYDKNNTNDIIEKFTTRTKGVGSYKCKIAAGNVKAVRDFVSAQKNVKSALLKAKGELAILKRPEGKELSAKM